MTFTDSHCHLTMSNAEAHLAAAFLIKYGIWPAQFIEGVDLAAPMPREELYALLGSWLREHSALQEANGKIFAVSGRTVTLKAEGKLTEFRLPENAPLFLIAFAVGDGMLAGVAAHQSLIFR